MFRRWFAIPALGLSLLQVACSSSNPANIKGSNVSAEATNVDIGEMLFTPTEFRPSKPNESAMLPIVVPLCHLTVLQKLDLPSRADGTIAWIGVELKDGEAPPKNARDLYVHKRTGKKYRRLQLGDAVERDQVVALLDDEQAAIDYIGADTKLKASEKEAAAYNETASRLQKIESLEADALAKGASSLQNYLSAQATTIRYQADATSRVGAAAVAASETAKAKHILEKHEHRTVISGEVALMPKQAGEGVKATEPLLIIQNFDRLRVEGNLGVEFVERVRPGDEVFIEAPRTISEDRTFDIHTTNKAITAIVVGTRGGKPVVISAGEDGWVHAWDRDLNVLASWKQRSAVRALACTIPTAAESLALVGSDDGKARLYDLSGPSKEPLRELEGKHEGGVTAAAFSPDGKHCVTSDDRNIYLWDVATGKKKYRFPQEHHSLITALHFTPQCRVVSAGKEPSVKVWKVGEKSASVENRFDSRAGDVTTLGVTDEGTRLVLDADKTRLDIINLADGHKERGITAYGESTRFTTFGVISPEIGGISENRLLATAGVTEGVVQLWRAPSSTERGTELRRLATRNFAPPTCAAFSPNAENGFIVVGTKKGDVHLWAMPTDAEIKERITATVTHIDRLIESSGKTVRFIVDFDNPREKRLRPGMMVNLVVQPRSK